MKEKLELLKLLADQTRLEILNILLKEDPYVEKGHLGKNASGLKHILDTHESQFAKQGIKADEIPQYLMTAVKTGHVVDYQGKGTGRPIYELDIW